MTDEPTPEERREQDHERTEPEPEAPPKMEPVPPRLDGIRKFLGPQKATVRRDIKNLLDGSVLDELIQEPLPPPGERAKLPSSTRSVLEMVGRLKVAMSPHVIGRLRIDLRAVRESADRLRKINGGRNDDPIPESLEQALEISAQHDAGWTMYREMDQVLACYEEISHLWESFVESYGYRWNWDTGVLELLPGASGGRPRQLLRNVVKALLLYFQVDENTAEVRERIASELAPFFSSSLLDTSRGSRLYNAVNHSLQGK